MTGYVCAWSEELGVGTVAAGRTSMRLRFGRGDFSRFVPEGYVPRTRDKLRFGVRRSPTETVACDIVLIETFEAAQRARHAFADAEDRLRAETPRLPRRRGR